MRPPEELTEDQRQVTEDAKRLLADPATARALAYMRAAFRKGYEESNFEEQEKREHYYQMLLACREFQRQLTSMSTKGKLEEMRRERATRAGGNAAS